MARDAELELRRERASLVAQQLVLRNQFTIFTIGRGHFLIWYADPRFPRFLCTSASANCKAYD